MRLFLAWLRPAPNAFNWFGAFPGTVLPIGAGGVKDISESMQVYLASWPDGYGESKNPRSRLQSGTEQWRGFGDLGVNIHLAERDPQHHAWAKHGADSQGLRLRILLSYWYYKDTDLDALFAKYFTPPYPDVFADSGAFSAMTQGVEITCEEYAAWIKRWKHLFCVYANLDVIKHAERTFDNQRRLEDMGLQPLPCFHVLESWDWLERYVEQYPYIALGVAGMQNRKEQILAWLVRCFRIAGKQAVFHGFALTSWEVMKSFPWYSVDSSSWGQGFRFGNVPVFDGRRGRFYKLGLGTPDWYKHAALVREMGFDPADFANRSRNDRAKICAISALSYMLAEQWLRRRHGEVHIPGQDGAPAGLRAHLADANPARFGEAVAGVSGPRLHLSDTSNGINFGDADKGLKLHLADARGPSGGEIAAAESGLNLYLAEHSLDRGG